MRWRRKLNQRLTDLEIVYAKEIPENLAGYIAAHDARLNALEDRLAGLETQRREELRRRGRLPNSNGHARPKR